MSILVEHISGKYVYFGRTYEGFYNFRHQWLFPLKYDIRWILSKIETFINLGLSIEIAFSAELNFKCLFLSIKIFPRVLERQIYRYGETILC